MEFRCGDLTLTFAETGPRITGLRVGDQENLFAELPGLVIERPGEEPFRFLGGHRLWLAPEVPAVTYLPDDEAVAFTHYDGHLRSRGAANFSTNDRYFYSAFRSISRRCCQPYDCTT